MPQPHIAMFLFRLGSQESIGPAALRAMWAAASGTTDVSVGREVRDGGWSDRPVYTLYAAQGLGNLAHVEQRLLRALDKANLHASLTALH